MTTIAKEGLTYMIPGTDEFGKPIDEANCLATNLLNDLLTNGFEEVAKDGPSIAASKKVILRPKIEVDPNWQSDPWHIYFEVKGNAIIKNPANLTQEITVADRGLYMRVGSPTQLPNIAGISTGIPEYPIIPQQYYTLTPDQLTSAGNITNTYPRVSTKTPMTYQLAIYNRGFAFVAWPQVFTEDLKFTTVFTIQRGVGCDGSVPSTGQKPLYLVTNVSATGSQVYSGSATGWNIDGPRTAWFYNVIREVDTTAPLPTWQSMTGNGSPSINDGPGNPINQPGNYALNYTPAVISDPRELLGQSLNYFPTRWRTPVTNDNNEYILVFPFGLCTDRFAFSEEIDLIAVSKADAYQSEQIVPVDVYGQKRSYIATSSNNQNVNNDSGIRVFVLKTEDDQNGG